MPSIRLHPPPYNPTTATPNPLPPLLQTPSGLALLELQGTLNLPDTDSSDDINIGRLVYSTTNPKKVTMFVGKHQRMVGEIVELPKPLGVVRRRGKGGEGEGEGEGDKMEVDGEAEELEIVEIVKYKVVFKTRPEPV